MILYQVIICHSSGVSKQPYVIVVVVVFSGLLHVSSRLELVVMQHSLSELANCIKLTD